MAKIDGGGSSDTSIMQLKDMYQQRERESDIHHREELNELRDSHRVEIEKVRGESDVRVKNVQEEANAKLSQKDVQFQKEIEALRAMYQKRAGEGKKVSDV
jgi:hypothetical protein